MDIIDDCVFFKYLVPGGETYDKKRAAEDNPTHGIILCTDTDADVAKYSVLSENKQLFASKSLRHIDLNFAEETNQHIKVKNYE